MLFAHDTEVALAATAALVNTAGTPRASEDSARRRRAGRIRPDLGLDRRTPRRPRPSSTPSASFARGCGGSGSRRGRGGRDRQRAAARSPGAAPAGQARRVALPPARHPARRPAGHPDGGRGGDGDVDVVRERRVGPAADLRVPTTATTSSSTCPRTGPSASATPAAATGRPSPPTAPAAPPAAPERSAHSPARSSYSTSPCSVPGIGSSRPQVEGAYVAQPGLRHHPPGPVVDRHRLGPDPHAPRQCRRHTGPAPATPRWPGRAPTRAAQPVAQLGLGAVRRRIEREPAQEPAGLPVERRPTAQPGIPLVLGQQPRQLLVADVASGVATPPVRNRITSGSLSNSTSASTSAMVNRRNRNRSVPGGSLRRRDHPAARTHRRAV